MIIKGPGIIGEVPLNDYILAMFDSALRLSGAIAIVLYFTPLWDWLPWWVSFADGLLIAVPVYAWHAIPAE
jgi:hypothetical protein